jgi:putative hydrolase of the HAD superfamily
LDGVSVVLFDVYGTLFVSASGDVATAKHDQEDVGFDAALRAAFGSKVAPDWIERARLLYYRLVDSTHTKKRDSGVAHPEVDAEEIWRTLLDTLSRDVGEPRVESVPKSLARRCAVEHEVRSNPVWPMPHARQILDSMNTTPVRRGIVSNAQFYTPLLFNAFLGGAPSRLGFEEELSTWSYQLGEAKPSVRMFMPILTHLREREGLAADNVVYVGNDMLNDVWTAGSVGCRTCLFAGDAGSLRLRNDNPQCRDIEPDIVITDLLQLSECVAGLAR